MKLNSCLMDSQLKFDNFVGKLTYFVKSFLEQNFNVESFVSI